MLVIARRENEKIVFPGLGVSVQIVKVNGKVVRLGIDAPPEVRILREEIHAKAAVDHEVEYLKPDAVVEKACISIAKKTSRSSSSRVSESKPAYVISKRNRYQRVASVTPAIDVQAPVDDHQQTQVANEDLFVSV
ncbi:MAG TPA: carbon storage regulator [Pirellulaceae bacterium]|nr:carbon storage regulator [Pirellulaceae bacterium]HMO92136.1 carbon storage regulator [Pirellulaceae bacterium]HMP68939.1 carbon storage regulator [Pirellulaceae bacterium]